jgi:two-component SAPR family response regulator
MSRKGPLILVDDDADDQELMMISLRDLGLENEVKCFDSAEAALQFLYSTSEQPFMIVSDINMPKMDGIAFKRKIDSCNILKPKCIPFVFLSTSIDRVKQSCDLNIQGFFKKGNSLSELNETIKIILKYWDRTYHIN